MLQDRRDQRVLSVLLDQQGLLGQLEMWGQLVLQGLQDRLDQPVQLGMSEPQELLVQLELQVASGLRDLLDLLEVQALLARKVRQDQQGL